jgi:hypothetical protein
MRELTTLQWGQLSLRPIVGTVLNPQSADLELPDLDAAKGCPADLEAANAEPPDREAADGGGADRERADRRGAPSLHACRRDRSSLGAEEGDPVTLRHRRNRSAVSLGRR